MDEHGPRDQAEDKPKARMASADWLLRDDPAARSAPRSANPAVPASGSGEVFDLVESPDADLVPPPRTGPAAPGAAIGPRAAPSRRGDDKSQRKPEVLVEEVWSRWAEWGPTLAILAGWSIGLVILLYFLMGYEFYGMAFLLLLVGVAAAVVLSYPILITLERPVRVTPEQAVRDFYGALSHHRPHFRRMWLLLSTAGRTTASYGSYEGFKAYWIDRLRELKGRNAGPITPLVFEVVNYLGDKSAGQSRIDAEFTVKVSVRGQRQAGPIGTFRMRAALARGPDKMWYLENGNLPASARERQPG
jgi:hypothetical protein